MGAAQVILCLLWTLKCFWSMQITKDKPYREGTSDVSNMYSAKVDLINKIRYMNKDLPEECKHDSCLMTVEETKLNGVLVWPNTTVGMRRYIKCPYAEDNEVLYAHRDCIPISRGDKYGFRWSPHNISRCPGPPLNRTLVKYVIKSIREPSFSLAYWEQLLQEVYDITDKYPDAPVYPGDIMILVEMFEDYLHKTLYISGCTVFKNYENILLTSDFALASLLRGFRLDGIVKVSLLEVMTTIIKKLPAGTKLRRPTHQYLLNMTVIEQKHVGPQPVCFETDVGNNTVKDCQVEIEVDLLEPAVELKTLVFQDNIPDMFYFNIYEQQSPSKLPVGPPGGPPAGPPSGPPAGPPGPPGEPSHGLPRRPPIIKPETLRATSSGLTSTQEPTLTTEPNSSLSFKSNNPILTTPSTQSKNSPFGISDENSSLPDLVIVTASSPEHTPDNVTAQFSGSEFSPDLLLSTGMSSTPVIDAFPILPTRQIMTVRSRPYRQWGPLVYISTDTGKSSPASVIKQVTLTFRLRTSWTELKKFFSGTVMCGNLPGSRTLLDDEDKSRIWSPDMCVRVKPVDLDIIKRLPETVTCRCNATTGYFGAFVYVFAEIRGMPGYPRGGISELLGFTVYSHSSYPLYITNHVLRALSLVCLILTITSFIVFRKLRSGSPAFILINLCAALIALNLVLYITEGIAHTKMGCRASNLLRYYFILVTLLWNAVEAANMYLMLVKVFGSKISRFTRKAAGFAWGLPLIPVIILLAIDKSSFDGYFVDCKFRCLLKKQILHFALLVPIGVIMLFNIVVFGIVLSVIVKHGTSANKTGKKRMWLIRLFGAMAALALLGIPWIFAGFGAIDPNGHWELERVELAFQVIFVVFFNLQGIFIFLFHCVRSSEVRTEWKSTLSGWSTSTSTILSARHSQSSTSGANTGVIGDSNEPNTHSNNTQV